ncbi:MAG: UDP-diphosphatase, partial [Microbacterium sp.]|nr:UDP-diphosphatase [Microbacterium sp.]
FLLAIPAVFASGFFELYKTVKGPSHHEVFSMGETAVATVVAFVVGLAVIAFFMRWISRHSFLPFVVYRVALGAALLVLLSTGVIQP